MPKHEPKIIQNKLNSFQYENILFMRKSIPNLISFNSASLDNIFIDSLMQYIQRKLDNNIPFFMLDI